MIGVYELMACVLAFDGVGQFAFNPCPFEKPVRCEFRTLDRQDYSAVCFNAAGKMFYTGMVHRVTEI